MLGRNPWTVGFQGSEFLVRMSHGSAPTDQYLRLQVRFAMKEDARNEQAVSWMSPGEIEM